MMASLGTIRKRTKRFITTALQVLATMTTFTWSLVLPPVTPDIPNEPLWPWERSEVLPPPPPPSDDPGANLPEPLSVADARWLLTGAKVFAPGGIGMSPRAIQGDAIDALLNQATSLDVLLDIYERADVPGRLLALCAIHAVDPAAFVTLSTEWTLSTDTVITYSGCTGMIRSAAEIVSEISTARACAGR